MKVGRQTTSVAHLGADRYEPHAKGNAEGLSFLEAAEYILDRFANAKPMHYRDVTKRALELGLIKTKGQTPEATLSAQLSVDIERNRRQGEASRFYRADRGMIGLTKWHGSGLGSQIGQHNERVRKALHAQLVSMPPQAFEALIGRLLVAIGFEDVSVTEYQGDGGIDVRATLVVGGVMRTRMAVQVKRWKANIQAPAVQQVRGSLGAHERGLVITTSRFSKGAIEEAARPDRDPVALMDGEQLIGLLVEHDIGVRRSSYDLIELGEEEPM
jgi:restriction system protein